MLKSIWQKLLIDNGWYGVNVGSQVVTYCRECGVQRPHKCIRKTLNEEKKIMVVLKCCGCNFT